MPDESDVSSAAVSPPSAPLRPDMIDSATKFLQNLKVQARPVEQRKAFLRSKGLTEEEIVAAFSQAGVSMVETAPARSVQPNVPVVPNTVMETRSILTLIKDYSTVTIIIGSVVYALHWFYQKFVHPYFTAYRKKQEEKLERIESAITELRSKVDIDTKQITIENCVMQQKIVELTAAVGRISTAMAKKDQESSKDAGLATVIKPLHDDVSSLKSLILSSKQFPSNPVQKPVIPSWQLKNSTAKHNGTDKETSSSGFGTEETSVSGNGCESEEGLNRTYETEELEDGFDESVESEDDEMISDSKKKLSSHVKNHKDLEFDDESIDMSLSPQK